jgi:hypothetical protein
MTGESKMTVFEKPSPPADYNVGVAYTQNGKIYDYLGNWETAQTYANDGYMVRALRGDGHLSRDDLQAMVDNELAAAVDCFGEEHRK